MPRKAQSIAEFQRRERERRKKLRGETPSENALKTALGKKESTVTSLKRGIGAEIKKDVSGVISKSKNFLAELLKKAAATAEAKKKRKEASAQRRKKGK